MQAGDANVEGKDGSDFIVSNKNLAKLFADLVTAIGNEADIRIVLILFFLKRASDKWEKEFDLTFKQTVSEGIPEEYARKEAMKFVYHDVDIPQDFLWRNIISDPQNVSRKLLLELEKLSLYDPELKRVVDSTAINKYIANKDNEKSVSRLVHLLDGDNFADTTLIEIRKTFDAAITGLRRTADITETDMLNILWRVFEPRIPSAIEARYEPSAEGG
jgi:type I restriction-modification system DNA methylase subunit